MRCALRARGKDEVVAIGRDLAADPAKLREALPGVDAVLHLAGVNRAGTEERLNDNVLIAKHLTDALDKTGVHPIVVYANSIQSGNATAFGETKKAAAEHLIAWGRTAGAPVADVHLPNLFGEHGRPNYNSVVATFCNVLAHGGKPKLVEDRVVQLLHAQDAADSMLELIDQAAAGVFQPQGVPIKVSALMAKLEGFHRLYLEGDIPDITSRFDRALFNTYRSFCFPDHYPIYPQVRADPRGELFEAVRGLGSQCNVFLSSTRPGITRGDHFHRRKVERFLVLHGRAVIALRRLFDDRVIRFEVSGDRPAIVDMPTMWTQSITNTGSDDLTTLFWADEIFDPEHPDTYREPVELERQTA
jgi:UDP-2-acetamido-2,6-beta-L-arabino-hexul-4-ose reductase